MTKHKTCDLDGDLLDLAVAKAEGAAIEHSNMSDGWIVAIPGMSGARIVGLNPDRSMAYAPSLRWDQGGPIIEREQISIVSPDLNPIRAAGLAGWQAAIPGTLDGSCTHAHGVGPTPLIAAMRAFVASRFGDEVEL